MQKQGENKTRGDRALLEISQGKHLLHWPETRGIPIEVELTGMYGRRTSGIIALWHPDLTREPIRFTKPAGRINWSPQ